jgi:mono/diheme cytochrome c family protein
MSALSGTLIISANLWEFSMLRVALVFCVFVASSCHAVWAGPAVRTFASDLMLLESKQVLHEDQPFRYASPETGTDLRKLLNPERAKLVSDEYFEGLIGNVSEPEIPKLLQPLLMRYDKAFTASPIMYEDEYLDTLNWTALIVQRSMRWDAKLVDQKISSSPDETRAVGELLASLKGLADSMIGLLEKNIREKVSKGLFSEKGKMRALELANQISPVRAGATHTGPKSQVIPDAQDLQSGKKVYDDACAACHGAGATGAPKRGDVAAWAPRLKSGWNSLLRSTLYGKGVMPAMDRVGFREVEIAKAVAYLANFSGGNFAEPIADGQPAASSEFKRAREEADVVRASSISYSALDAGQKLKFGERVYEMHCAACHQPDGRGAGPIPSLGNAPTFTKADTAIKIVLNGSKNRSMPGWAALKDEEIAEVINYSRSKFSNQLVEYVAPDDVRRARIK